MRSSVSPPTRVIMEERRERQWAKKSREVQHVVAPADNPEDEETNRYVVWENAMV